MGTALSDPVDRERSLGASKTFTGCSSKRTKSAVSPSGLAAPLVGLRRTKTGFLLGLERFFPACLRSVNRNICLKPRVLFCLSTPPPNFELVGSPLHITFCVLIVLHACTVLAI